MKNIELEYNDIPEIYYSQNQFCCLDVLNF